MELYVCVFAIDTLPNETDDLRKEIDVLPFGDAEQQRMRRISHTDTLRQGLGGKLALQRITEELGLSSPLTILRDANGKPFFSDPALPSFSISHSGNLALAVLSTGSETPIGADLQFVTAQRDPLRIAARCLTQREMEECAQGDDPTQCFFRIWSQKEAVAKQSGEGLAAIFSHNEEDSALLIRSFRLRYGAQIAYLSVATSEEVTQIHWIHSIKELSYEQL